MRNKSLNQEEVIERYNSINGLIDYFKNTGTVGGLAYTIISIGSQDVGTVGIFAGIGAFSFFSGDYLQKLNNNKKYKTLKNIEMEFEGDKK